MKKKTVRGAILSLILTLGLSTAAFADGMDMGGNVTEKKIDGINVELSFQDEKVKTGKNEIMLNLHDSNDKEIEISNVSIIAKMADDSEMEMDMNMDESKPIEVNLESSEEGQYMGEIDFTDKGKWVVTANFVVDGKEKSLDFDVEVADGGPNWIVIGGFVGIVAVIIIVAAVKKKSSK
ncbi:hypothetical protein CBU02nite_34890 [Clostridium butyricum]|jgi:hypothetical protein|uniref:YtkA-like domain-containing protein n=1 Tax=Clostridium butyricum TaxID=1492 RepID=A0A512TS93_CLOBU|nr:FixH family protein [Clostridium butyricum]NOW22651.1 hypothetical protein [Clostridium butyricum]GEQ22983.1 hypothetical protein CBU02nite_34890 [Clostridium butyricum]